MPTTPTTALKPAFIRTVQDLVRQRDTLQSASIQFKRMWVEFCVNYTRAYDEAREIGRDAVALLNEKVGITDQSVLSKMRQVAEVKQTLSSKVLAALPPSREAIVDLARAELRHSGTIQRLIDGDKVTPESSVREVRAALSKRRRASTQPTAIQTVTVTFADVRGIADALANVLLTTQATVAVTDDRLRDAIKQTIGKERWNDVATRLTQ
jgi:hypothetical protein